MSLFVFLYSFMIHPRNNIELFAGNLLPSILTTCSNHISLLLLILLTSVSVCPKLLPDDLVTNPVSSGLPRYSSQPGHFCHQTPTLRFIHQNWSDKCLAQFYFCFCCYAGRFPHRAQYYLPNIAVARPVLRLMSFVHGPSSVINL